MSLLEAFLLGIIQGLTEFLPVSSSGHLELGKALLGLEPTENLSFTIVVHAATVMSTVVVFHKDILGLIRGLLAFKWNEETQDIAKLAIAAIPIVIIGLFFRDEVKSLFNMNILLVGCLLLCTGGLLSFTYYSTKREGPVTYGKAFIIGLAQAIAVLPGISRSGATIATGLLLGVDKARAARFSFLIVLVPIIGACAKDILDGGMADSPGGAMPLIVGFVAAFVSGVFACRWMISIVTKGKLIYFAVYCFIAGAIAIVTSFV